MSPEKNFTNATLILPDRVIQGSFKVENGIITVIDEDTMSLSGSTDCGQDFILPGLIEIHTDNLEKYVVPRPGIYWPSPLAAIIAHDNQIFSSGITTVLDAISVGFSDTHEARTKILDTSISVVKHAQALELLKADHFLHLRCELPSSSVYDSFATYVHDPLIRLVSVMDHTPGQRQWRDLPKWRTFNEDRKWTDKEAQAVMDHRCKLQEEYSTRNRLNILKICKTLDIPVASHDDTTVEHCHEAWKSGITISEFPTTIEAARTAKQLGMNTIMGAPNMVRGESHSGNVSACELAEADILDGLSSDYMPISLLHAAFEINTQLQIPLPDTIAKVTANIAKMTRLEDRGELVVGKKADFIRVRLIDRFPVILSVWKDGEKVLDNTSS